MSYYGHSSKQLGYNAPPPKEIQQIVASGGSSGVTNSQGGSSMYQTASGQAAASGGYKPTSSAGVSIPDIDPVTGRTTTTGRVITNPTLKTTQSNAYTVSSRQRALDSLLQRYQNAVDECKMAINSLSDQNAARAASASLYQIEQIWSGFVYKSGTLRSIVNPSVSDAKSREYQRIAVDYIKKIENITASIASRRTATTTATTTQQSDGMKTKIAPWLLGAAALFFLV